MLITEIIGTHESYYDRAEFPDLQPWSQWINFVTTMYPLMQIGDDGILYLIEH